MPQEDHPEAKRTNNYKDKTWRTAAPTVHGIMGQRGLSSGSLACLHSLHRYGGALCCTLGTEHVLFRGILLPPAMCRNTEHAPRGDTPNGPFVPGVVAVACNRCTPCAHQSQTRGRGCPGPREGLSWIGPLPGLSWTTSVGIGAPHEWQEQPPCWYEYAGSAPA